MLIQVDQDEILCRWADRILEWYNQDMRGLRGKAWKDVTLEDISCWDVKTNLGPESEIYIRSYMRASQFYQNLEPVEGAIEGIRELMKSHDVVVTTAIPKCAGMAYEGKKEWLRNHIPEFPLNNLIGISRKDLVCGDVIIDDALHNVLPFVKDNYKLRNPRYAILLDRPWNKMADKDLPANVFRCFSWSEIIDTVKHIELMSFGYPVAFG